MPFTQMGTPLLTVPTSDCSVRTPDSGMNMKYLLKIALVLFISCSTVPQHYVLKEEIYRDEFSKIKVLSENDINSLPDYITIEYLFNHFGAPFLIPTEIPIYTYPKKRDDIDLEKDSDEVVWRNGYWFILKESERDKSEYQVQFIISSNNKLPESKEWIFPQFDNMFVDWPEAYKGKKVKELGKKWIFN